jgi:hypothetical protein
MKGTAVRLLLIGSALAFIAGTSALCHFRSSSKGYQQLAALTLSMELDTKQKDAVSLASRYDRLAATWLDDDVLIISTPIEFGAGNWTCVVYIPDGHVRGIGLRQADNVKRRIPEFSSDRVSPAWAEKWNERLAAWDHQNE